MEVILKTIIIGIGATLIMDFWGYLQRMVNIKTLDYRFVGRWISKFPKGEFLHENIALASPEKYEIALGWLAHYLIGITFSALLVVVMGKEWLEKPTFLPALLIGIVTIIAPFCIMQPAFGFGFAASKMPNSNTLRLLSFLTHSIYGVGLFVVAYGLNYISSLSSS